MRSLRLGVLLNISSIAADVFFCGVEWSTVCTVRLAIRDEAEADPDATERLVDTVDAVVGACPPACASEACESQSIHTIQSERKG